jgi:hypothetical protein
MQVGRPPLTRALTYTIFALVYRYISKFLVSQHANSQGDTKAGTLIGTDRFGNKYYENLEELPRKLLKSTGPLNHSMQYARGG